MEVFWKVRINNEQNFDLFCVSNEGSLIFLKEFFYIFTLKKMHVCLITTAKMFLATSRYYRLSDSGENNATNTHSITSSH